MQYEPMGEWWPLPLPANQKRNRAIVMRYLVDGAIMSVIATEAGISRSRVALILQMYHKRLDSPCVHDRNGRFGHVKYPRVEALSPQLIQVRKKRNRPAHELVPPPEWLIESWETT